MYVHVCTVTIIFVFCTRGYNFDVPDSPKPRNCNESTINANDKMRITFLQRTVLVLEWNSCMTSHRCVLKSTANSTKKKFLSIPNSTD